MKINIKVQFSEAKFPNFRYNRYRLQTRFQYPQGTSMLILIVPVFHEITEITHVIDFLHIVIKHILQKDTQNKQRINYSTNRPLAKKADRKLSNNFP